jgi:hypothetical protein
MGGPLDADLACPLENVQDFLGAEMNMAEGGVGFEGQSICHHVLGPEVAVDQPL